MLGSRQVGSGGPRRRVLLVAPRHPQSFWSMQGTVDLFGARTLMPNAALATLMALTPDDVCVEYLHVDENVAPLAGPVPCDLVVLTGSRLHARRIEELSQKMRAAGTPVALGGPYATLHSDRCRQLCDHLFVGEAEHTWPLFLREWFAGTARQVYVQEGPVDLRCSPAPDWSLVRPADYIHMPVQTSRGCPNRCDFCDVVQYLGPGYRRKSVEQVLAEVQAIHRLGHRSIFFSDDSFLGNRRQARELVTALGDWNCRQEYPASFSTQITMDVGDDEELLRLMADARFSVLFLGLETVRRQSLEEVHKGHNLRSDPVTRLQRIARHGLVPFVGLVVGFDHDDAAVFDELAELLDRAAAPVAGISLLNAPYRTPLYHRMKSEGRLREEDFGGEWQLATNIVPLNMTAADLEAGYWRLFRRVYDPRGFEARLRRWLGQVDYVTDRYTRRRHDFRQYLKIVRVLRYCLGDVDPEVRRMFLRMAVFGVRHHPRLLTRIFTFLGQYRHFHDFVAANAPAATA